MPGRGFLRALIVLTAAAGAVAYALRKLGIIGGDDRGSAGGYGSSVNDGEDETADE